jgi:hypothetical protein
MRYTKLFGWALLAAGIAFTGTAANAQPAYWDHYQDRDMRHDQRDLGADYARVNRMQADIARDQARLNEDIRCGRRGAAAAQAADLARDQRALNNQLRDIRHDRRDLNHDYRNSWR